MKTLPPRLLLTITALVTILASRSTFARTLLDDTFDTARTDQNLPSSSAWYLRGNANSLTAGTGEMVLDSSGDTLNLVSYFTGSSTPYTLNEGNSLTLSVTFEQSAVDDSGEGVRIGLFNSGGNRVSGDSTNFLSSTFNNYTGYSAWFNPANTSDSYNILERVGSSSAIFSSSSSVNSVLGSGNSSTINIVPNTQTTLTFSITRTASGLTIVSTVNGVELSREDLSATEFSYDTIALQLSSSVLADGDTMTFHEVSVTGIPEPSTMAFGLGAVVLLLVGLKRRKS